MIVLRPTLYELAFFFSGSKVTFYIKLLYLINELYELYLSTVYKIRVFYLFVVLYANIWRAICWIDTWLC